MLLAIDPGTTESGYCVFRKGRLHSSGVLENSLLLTEHLALASHYFGETPIDNLVIEMVASYGMPVGREVFETVRWIGRFQQSWRDPNAVRLIYRRDVKLHLCGNARAKDANIRQALIDKLGPVGTKGAPGPLYGVKSHAWAALAVAVTALETK